MQLPLPIVSEPTPKVIATIATNHPNYYILVKSYYTNYVTYALCSKHSTTEYVVLNQVHEDKYDWALKVLNDAIPIVDEMITI